MSDWHEWRSEGVGASEVAQAAGLTVYGRDAFDLWALKTHRTHDNGPETERMLWGKLLEPVIVQRFTAETGLHVVGEQTWCVHPQHGHHRATVDGFVVESPASAIADALGVLEIKTGQWTWNDLPDHVTIQTQWQLHVTGLERSWVAYLQLSGPRFTVHEVKRDDELIATLVTRVDEFWTHVQDDTPPPPSAYSDVAAAYPQATPDSVELTGDAVSWYDRAIVLRDLVRNYETELEEAKHHLQVAMGEASTATLDGVPVATWKQRLSTRIDAKALEADHPELADQYRRTTSTRTFLLKELS